jgi:phenol hydroxylase P0 protein
MRSTSPAAAATPIPVETPSVCDTTRRFVRVIDERADGLIAFEFAIGWPELSVELLLPAAAFAEFCVTNRVQRLDRHSPPENERRQAP